MKRIIIIVFLVGVFFSSCSHQRMVFLQPEVYPELDYTEYTDKPLEYILRPDDVLYIRFTSYNKEISELFNQSMGGNNQNMNNMGNMNQNSGSMYFSGYLVDKEGFISMPILGDIKVAGSTFYDVQKLIQEQANEYLDDAIVTTRLISNQITFMGEVGSPGTKTFYRAELNIYEALINAGGVTEYADTKNILVVRPTENGYLTYRLDITTRQLLESEKLYLLPNDIVYVEPVRIKAFRLDANNLFFYISTVSSLVTTTFLILNYNK